MPMDWKLPWRWMVVLYTVAFNQFFSPYKGVLSRKGLGVLLGVDDIAV
jgi:hypothetical protein